MIHKLIWGNIKRTYEFFDDAFVDEDGNGDAEDSDEGKVATGPAEVVLEILSISSPILDPTVLVSLHSAPHLFLSTHYFLSLGFR